MQQPLPRLLLELAPERVSSAQQGDVGRMLVVRHADDAGAAVVGAAIVRHGEPLEAEHAEAAAGEVVQRGAAHRAEADHDDVVRVRHGEA